MADNKETNQTAEHQCHECAKFLKKGCINLFPLRVKPTARACKSFIDPVSADKTYCFGAYMIKGQDPSSANTTCKIRERCKRYMALSLAVSGRNHKVDAENCANHGYPYYIRKGGDK